MMEERMFLLSYINIIMLTTLIIGIYTLILIIKTLKFILRKIRNFNIMRTTYNKLSNHTLVFIEITKVRLLFLL